VAIRDVEGNIYIHFLYPGGFKLKVKQPKPPCLDPKLKKQCGTTTPICEPFVRPLEHEESPWGCKEYYLCISKQKHLNEFPKELKDTLQFERGRALIYPGQPLTIGFTILGGLAADIDEPRSLLGRPLFFISLPLSWFFGHRTITHSLLGGGILSALMITALNAFGVENAYGLLWPWSIGYAMHLLLDSMTSMGVPLLWPYLEYYGLKLSDSGGLVEWLYTIGLVMVLFGTPWGQSILLSLTF